MMLKKHQLTRSTLLHLYRSLPDMIWPPTYSYVLKPNPFTILQSTCDILVIGTRVNAESYTLIWRKVSQIVTGIIEHHLIDRHEMRQNISTNDIYKRCGDDEVEVSVSNSEIWLAIQDSSFLTGFIIQFYRFNKSD